MTWRVLFDSAQVEYFRRWIDARNAAAESRRQGRFAKVQRYHAGSADAPGEWITEDDKGRAVLLAHNGAFNAITGVRS